MSKKGWDLSRHRKQSPQFNEGINHTNKLWWIGIIVSFFVGIIIGFILQVYILPSKFNEEPDMNVRMYQEKKDVYVLRILNNGNSIEDVTISQTIPGVAIEIVEQDSPNTNCNFYTIEQGYCDGKCLDLEGQEAISIGCERMGSSSRYGILIKLDSSKYNPSGVVHPSGKSFTQNLLEISNCYFYTKGYNNEIIKHTCKIERP